jgi:hypothetical protein
VDTRPPENSQRSYRGDFFELPPSPYRRLVPFFYRSIAFFEGFNAFSRKGSSSVGIRSSAVSFIFESIIFFFAHMFFIFELLISCVFVSYELSCVFCVILK